MKLDPSQLSALSRLLDEALDQAENERRAWLQALGDEYTSLKPLLERMLAARDSAETSALIDTLPQLDIERDHASGHAAGDLVGGYLLQRELGRGGMGEVWLAERSDGPVRRPVALKLPFITGARRVLVDRFNRECEILARLTHPNIARLYDVGFTADTEPFLALEYVEGTPITVYCDRLRLDNRGRICLFLQVLAAVQYAHSSLVLHRDVKPSNILVTSAGEVKLLDFGIAKLMTEGSARETELTRLGGRALTLDYASPEQITGGALTTASDVYALGVVLYELLTGERPHRLKRGTRAELEEAILAGDPARPSTAIARDDIAQLRGGSRKAVARGLAGDLDSIVLKSLKREPEQRYPTVAELSEDLKRYLDGRAVHARPESRWYRMQKFVTRNRLATGAGAAVMASLVLGLAATLWQANVAREQARVAEREAKASDAIAAFLIGLFKPNDLRTSSLEAAKRITADQLLDIGYERSKTELKDAPAVRGRLLAELGEIYKNLDKTDQAIAIAKERIALLTGISADPIEIANAYKQLASWELAYDHESDADAHLQAGLKAIENLDTAAGRRERGNMFQVLGEIAYGRDLDRSHAYFQKAVDLLSQHPVKEDEYPNALQGLAYTRTERGDIAGGIQAITTMRAERVKRWGADSMMVDIVDNLATGLYIITGQTKVAEENNLRNVASMEAKLPPLDFSLLNAKTLRGRILVEEERFPEAIAALQQVLALIRSKQSDEVTNTSALTIALSAAYVGSGDALRAKQAADDAVALLEKRAPDSMRHTVILAQEGRLLTMQGEFAEARRVLLKARAQTANATAFNSDSAARTLVRLADVAVAEGQYAAAGSLLDEADATIKETSPWLGYIKDLVATRRAAVEVEQGHYAVALPMASAALDSQMRRSEPNGKRELQADAQILIGRALLGTGKPEEAADHLRAAIELREAAGNPDSIWLAEAYVYLATCERGLGRRDAARELLTKAEKIHAAQAPLGTFLARPLEGLRASLAS